MGLFASSSYSIEDDRRLCCRIWLMCACLLLWRVVCRRATAVEWPAEMSRCSAREPRHNAQRAAGLLSATFRGRARVLARHRQARQTDHGSPQDRQAEVCSLSNPQYTPHYTCLRAQVSKQGFHFSGICRNVEMSKNSAKVSEKSRKTPKVRDRSGTLCSQGNLIEAAQQNAGDQTVMWWKYSHNWFLDGPLHYLHVLRSSYNLPVLHLYCNSFFIRDVYGVFGLISVHLFDILAAISSTKVREISGTFFCLESSNPKLNVSCMIRIATKSKMGIMTRILTFLGRLYKTHWNSIVGTYITLH